MTAQATSSSRLIFSRSGTMFELIRTRLPSRVIDAALSSFRGPAGRLDIGFTSSTLTTVGRFRPIDIVIASELVLPMTVVTPKLPLADLRAAIALQIGLDTPFSPDELVGWGQIGPEDSADSVVTRCALVPRRYIEAALSRHHLRPAKIRRVLVKTGEGEVNLRDALWPQRAALRHITRIMPLLVLIASMASFAACSSAQRQNEVAALEIGLEGVSARLARVGKDLAARRKSDEELRATLESLPGLGHSLVDDIAAIRSALNPDALVTRLSGSGGSLDFTLQSRNILEDLRHLSEQLPSYALALVGPVVTMEQQGLETATIRMTARSGAAP